MSDAASRRVLLDACVPHWLRHELSEFKVETARFSGLDGVSDSELLDAIEGRFDVLVTLDRNLTYQQKLVGRSIGVVVVRIRDQDPRSFRAVVPDLKSAVASVQVASILVVGP